MRAVVFLGPSLDVDRARRFLNAVFLPPCKMGDVFAAAEQGPAAIGIIDGLFEQTPAVWHKEILYAMSKGIQVFGGASMGALRAAELHQFGMRGVGRIFEDYASGVLEDDDEVAVSHLPGEAGFQCQSDAMVNIRHGLELAASEGVITEPSRQVLLSSAKGAHYPQRSWAALYEIAPSLGVPDKEIGALKELVERKQPDTKRDDAIRVLTEMASWLSDAHERAQWTTERDFAFEPTLFWDHLRMYFGQHGLQHNSAVHTERVLNHVRLVEPDRKRLREQALLLFLVDQEAKRLGLKPPEVRSSLERFRRERGLASADSLARWREAELIGKEECVELACLENVVLNLEQRYAEQIDRYLEAVLKLQGRYRGLVETVRQKWEGLDALGVTEPSEDDIDSVDAVMSWYQDTYGKIHTDVHQHIAELGFGSVRQFLSELFGQYLYARSSGSVANGVH